MGGTIGKGSFLLGQPRRVAGGGVVGAICGRMSTTNRFAKKVQAALEGLHLSDDPDKDALRKLVQSLDKRRRNRILRAALKSYFESEALKPYQAELIKMQAHLERHGRKAIILFDGRDASGKGGTIRRVTRYMNEKH